MTVERPEARDPGGASTSPRGPDEPATPTDGAHDPSAPVVEARDQVSGPDAEPPKEASPSATRPRRLALGVGLLAGGVVAAALLLRPDGTGTSPATEPAERGVACPYLWDASEQLVAGNETAFVEAVKVAARKAELALGRSGERFGHPEKLALELAFTINARPPGTSSRAAKLMADIKEACADLGRWSP